MKHSMGLSFGRKIGLLLCTFLAVTAIAAGVLLPTVYERVFAETPQKEEQFYNFGSSSPMRDYTSISVQVPSGLAIYADITTAGDFKRDIEVIGTYTTSQGSSTVKLAPSEYGIRMDGSLIADANKFYGPIEEASPATIEIECGKLIYSLGEVEVKVSTPEYSSLSVSLPAGVTRLEDDHTPETLKDLLSVKGVFADGSEELIVNKELYRIESGSLTVGSGNTVSVTYLPKESCIGNIKNLTVIKAEVQRISVSAAEDLILVGDYYRREEEGFENGISVFVEGMKAADILPSLSVTAHYPNMSRVIRFSADWSQVITDGIETCAVTNNEAFSEGSQTVNVSVTDDSGAVHLGSFTVRFEKLTVAKITATYHGPDEYDSATRLDKSYFTVIPTYNNNVTSDDTSFSDFTVDGDLTPTASQISDALSKGEPADYVYSKSVWLRYTRDSEVCCKIDFENIKYKRPSQGLGAIGGGIATQTILKDFDYSGLYVELKYSLVNTARASLSDLKDLCRVDYLDKNGEPFETNPTTIVKDIGYACITFTYGDSSVTSNYYPVVVQQATYEFPELDLSDIDYSENNCNKKINNIDRILEKGDLKISVSDVAGKEVGATYIGGGRMTDVKASDESVGATFDAEHGIIGFTRGGTFTVKFTLINGDDGDYRWEDCPQKTNYELVYTVTVNRGLLDVRLTFEGAEITNIDWIYGSPKNIEAIGKTVGSNNVVDNMPSYKLYHYRDGESSSSRIEGLPTIVGSYWVIAVTDENDIAYRQSTTFARHALHLTIDPKPIEESGLLHNNEYSRTFFSAEDFISDNSSGFLSSDMDANGKPPITVSFVDNGVECQHVGSYDIRVEITNKNYVWVKPSDPSKPSELVCSVKVTSPEQSFNVVFTDSFEYGTKNTELTAPSVQKNEPFYAKIDSTPLFYKADTNGNMTGSPLSFDSCHTWDVGNYIVIFNSAVNTEMGDNIGDYVPPTSNKTFSVQPRKVKNVTVVTTSPKVYDGTLHDFVLEGYNDTVMTYAVKGVTYDGAEFDSEIVKSGGTVKVKYAGTYTVTVSLKNTDNYTWAQELGGSLIAIEDKDCIISFSVDRREIKYTYAQQDEMPEYKFPYMGGSDQTVPTFAVDESDAVAIADGLTLSYETYESAELLVKKDPTSDGVGNYYLKFIFTADMVGGFNLSDNYVLPSMPEKFEIISAVLETIPELKGSAVGADHVVVLESDGKTLRATYSGLPYLIEKYFVWTDGLSINVKQDGLSAELKNAARYAVKVMPAPNYSWKSGLTFGGIALEEDSEIEFTFVIDKLRVLLTWSDTVKIYDAENAQKPSVSIDNRKGSDNVSVTVKVGSSADTASLSAVKDAGDYFAVAYELEGTDAGNYMIDKSGSDYSVAFVIRKQQVVRPSLDVNEIMYGTSETVKFDPDNNAAYWQRLSSAALNVGSAVVGVDWFDNAFNEGDGAFDVAGGSFTYIKAGKYTVTLTLGDTANYCWQKLDESESYDIYKEYTTTSFDITVARKTLTAPSIGNDRTMRWTGAKLTPNLTTSVDSSWYERSYGTYIDGKYGSASSDSVAVSRGEYYVRYGLIKDDKYNYIWIPNVADHIEGLNGFVSKWEECVYTEDEVGVYIHFAVTNTILNVKFEFDNFVFGANAADSGATLSNILKVRNANSDPDKNDANELANEFLAGRVAEFTVIYYMNGKKIGEYILRNGVAETTGDLFNGLPWNAGTYDVHIAVEFLESGNQSSNFQSFNVNEGISLGIEPRPIEVDWFKPNGDKLEKDGVYEIVYNGGTHKLSAVIANAPVREGYSADDLILQVALDANGNLPFAVKGNEEIYKVYVIGISGEGSDNYAVKDKGVADFKCFANIRILRRSVKLTPSASGHIYGNAPQDNGWNVAESSLNGFAANDEALAKSYISVLIEESDTGNAVTNLSAVNGTYKVVLRAAGHSEFFNNYDLDLSDYAEYIITARNITVTVNENSAKSVYGSPVILTSSSDIYSLSEDVSVFGETKPLFTLVAKDGSGIGISQTTDVGRYSIELTDKNPDYIIDFGEYYYEIEKAELSVSVNLSIYYGENSPVNYDGSNHYRATVSDFVNDALLDNGMYKVRGFVNDDESKWGTAEFGLEGNAVSYSTDYDKDSPLNSRPGKYAFRFSAGDVQIKNYKFIDGGGWLTVKQIDLIVTVKNTSAVYSPDAVLSVEYDVTVPLQTYFDGVSLPEPDYTTVFILSTSAFKTVGTNDVGKYPIECTVTDNNYTVSLRGASATLDPEYEITPASLNVFVSAISAYGGAYDEKSHFVLLLEGNAEVEPSDSVKFPEYVNAFASTVDGSGIKVYYTIDATSSAVDWSTVNKTTDMPVVIDFGTYYVRFRIEAANHDHFESEEFIVNITKADNEFKDKYIFANDSDNVLNTEDLSAGFTALDKDAWTYGLYADNNPNGYNAAGAQTATMPETLFKKNAGDMTLKLYYYRSATEAAGMLLESIGGADSFTDIGVLISELLDSGKFNAGFYRIEMFMDGTDNYDSVTASRIFRIGKKALTVTPRSQSIVYGSDKPNYDFDYSESDFVCGGKIENGVRKKDTVEDLGLSSTSVPVFDAGYEIGDSAAGYTIAVTNRDDCIIQNYEFVFETSTLTVNKREVTIVIKDKENFFNLDNSYYITSDNGVKPETAALLEFSVLGQTDFYSDDKDHITLKTHAFDECVESTLTNNAGKYPIYAVWTDECIPNNYIIKFSCSEQGLGLTLPEEDNIIANEKEISWGTFTVKSARLSINYAAPREVYDGKVREIKPVLDEKYSNLIFETKYYTVDNSGNDVLLADGVLPIDVGTYKFEFIYKSSTNHENYISTASKVEFRITPATLTVRVNNAQIPYGTDFADMFVSGKESLITYSIAGMETDEVLDAIKFEFDKGGYSYFDARGLRFKSDYDFTKAAGTVWTVTASGITAKNYSISYLKVEDNLSVTQRDVVFTVKGFEEGDTAASGTYGDYHDDELKKQFAARPERFLTAVTPNWNGATNDGLSALCLILTVNARFDSDVGDSYVITAYQNAQLKSNYNVSFSNEVANYKVKPAAVTFSVSVKSEIIYGDEPVFEYLYEGFKNGQTYESLLRLNNPDYVSGDLIVTTDYSAWITHAGVRCTATYNGSSTLAFMNYIVRYETSSFNVVSRSITLGKFADVEYREDIAAGATDYHAGAYGAEHIPQLDFGNISDEYRPLYDLSYYNIRTGETLTSARTADSYNVTVSLRSNGISGGSYYDYVFTGESGLTVAERDFTVTKKMIGLSWSPSVIKYDDDSSDKSSAVSGIISDIMQIDRVYRQYNLNDLTVNTEDIVQGDGEREYRFDGSVLTLTAYNIGTYHAMISLKETALQNYMLTDGANTGISVDLLFRAVSDSNWVDISVSIEGWTYSQTPNEPKLTLYNGDTDHVSYAYAQIPASVDYDSLPSNIKVGFNDDSLLSVLSISGSNFNMKLPPSNVGLYVIRAYYSDTHQSAYYVFSISKAKITPPQPIVGEYVYNGTRHSVSFDFDDATCLTVTHSGELTTTPTQITISVTDAGTYTVIFALSDAENYEWADKAVLQDGKVILTWTVDKADDSVEDFESIASVYGAYVSPAARTVSGVSIYYFYRAITEAEINYTTADYSKLDGTEGWTDIMPVNHGSYWIRAFGGGNKNYNQVTAYARLTIDKAVLTATPTADIIYGNAFKPSGSENDGYGYELTGFVNGDSIYKNAPTGSVTYELKDGSLYGQVLNVGTYGLGLVCQNGEVVGLVSENYRVVGADGNLTVAQRSVSIKINNGTSAYGDSVILSDALWSITQGIDDPDFDKSTLGLTLGLENVTSLSMLDVDNYVITVVSHTNTNYRISYTTGIYTITARKLEITGINVNGGTVGNVSPAQVMRLTDVTDPDNRTPVGDDMFGSLGSMLTYNYTGTEDGSMPLKAGLYSVTVGIDSRNYSIVGRNTFFYEISKRIIDANEIKIRSMPYMNKIFTIDDLIFDYGIYDSTVCRAEILGHPLEVGTYTVVLTLTDFENTKWQSVEINERMITFDITQADNVVESFIIKGWIYGDYDRTKNAPEVKTKFGESSDYSYTYYADDGGKPLWDLPLLGVPTDSGDYWVCVAVAGSKNYKNIPGDSPVPFTIERAIYSTPCLEIIKGVNDTYTGENLQAIVLDFDSAAMEIYYDGISNISGSRVSVFARDAGTYTVKLSLKQAKNYRWSEDAILDSEGNAVLVWTVARKKLAAPVADTGIYIVNGKTLTYLPIGFDAQTMNISGNTTSYGGDHRVVVTLKDPKNYEWDVPEGADGSFVFVWHVVGADTVFGVVVGCLSALTAAAGCVALVQFLRHRKRMTALKNADTSEGGNV